MKHILLFARVAIGTYLLITLITFDFRWYVHNSPWIWLAVIPLFLFFYSLAFICFRDEMAGERAPINHTQLLIERLQGQLPDIVQGLVAMSMAEVRDDMKAMYEEQYRKINALSTDLYDAMERRNKLLDIEYRIKKHEADSMFLTKKATASLLMVSYATLRKWKKKGILVPIRITPHRELYRYSDVLKILEGKV